VALILVFGVDYRYVQAPYIGPTWRVGFADFPLRMLVPCLVSLLLVIALQLYLTRTFMGRAVMAVAQDQLALRLLAVDPIRVKRIAFGISIATAALAGACIIIIQPIEPSVGREYIGRVFAICVLGGMGSLPGTVIAAMLLGVVESFTATFYGPSWAPRYRSASCCYAGRQARRHPGTLAEVHRSLRCLAIDAAIGWSCSPGGRASCSRSRCGQRLLFFAGYVVLQFIVLATAWNILGGYCGYVNFGTAAFFAIGTYTSVPCKGGANSGRYLSALAESCSRCFRSRSRRWCWWAASSPASSA
jgi:ABC-type branched-subunit amino acid transport system permease subunit